MHIRLPCVVYKDGMAEEEISDSIWNAMDKNGVAVMKIDSVKKMPRSEKAVEQILSDFVEKSGLTLEMGSGRKHEELF